jgi:DNA gyrase subunit A
MSKKTREIVDNTVILDRKMEEVMHDSMMPYSEHVILERAVPRVEDGLKPVQRRVLFAMHEAGLTPDKPYRKSANIVGEWFPQTTSFVIASTPTPALAASCPCARL